MAREMDITVDPIDRAKLERELAGISNGVPKAIAVAVQRSLDTFRSRLVKGVAGDVAVKQKQIYEKNNRRRPVRTRLVRGQNRHVEGGVIDVGGTSGSNDGVPASARIPLGRFNPKPTGRKLKPDGVKYKLRTGGGAARIQADATGPFIVHFKSGYVGVFRRDSVRQRLVQLHGPSVPEVALNTFRMTNADMAAILEKNLASQVDRLLQRSRNG